MKALHDTRSTDYRAPYGAITPGTPVTLSIDVWNAPQAKVTLRTWTKSEGEVLHPMSATAANADNGNAPDGACGAPVRHSVTIAPEEPGIVWYSFIIESNGDAWRYGADEDRTGGVGALAPHEPPSFQLTVAQPHTMPPAWHEPIADYLVNGKAATQPAETMETLRENYPPEVLVDAFPWRWDAARAAQPDCIALPGTSSAVEIPSCFSANEDVFGTWQRDEAGNVLCALFNASPHNAYDIAVPLVGEAATELVEGYDVPLVDARDAEGRVLVSPDASRYALVHLRRLGSAIVSCHPRKRLQQPMAPGLGVLAHITSIPAAVPGGKAGSLGEPAFAFADWLAKADMSYWQVLPVNPTDGYGSPYAGISAFAGNVDLLDCAGSACAHGESSGDDAEFRAFCQREGDWLEPYASFMALRQKFGEETPWWNWPEPYRRFKPGLLDDDLELQTAAEHWKQLQFAFELQWQQLRIHANERGVRIIGDMPIYVSANSVDVWANRDIFQLGDNGTPAVVAGCPPDAFTADGQVWGNPVYDWDVLKEQGYSWWLRRLERAFALYDFVRLDHFIGFSRYFSIPAGEKALYGTYRPGPGMALFQAAFDQFGPLPIIAEDLGLITPGVRALSDACGFPGMDIVQFVDGGNPKAGYKPRPGKIAYTGTHDNQTLLGYVRLRYPDDDGENIAAAIMEDVAACPAPVSIFPLQDLMGLGDEARMNVPGTAEGNWAWKADCAHMPHALETARRLAALHREKKFEHEAVHS